MSAVEKMKAIKKVGPKLDSLDAAQSILNGLAKLDGFLFGHVDETEVRCVIFMRDTRPHQPILEGYERVNVKYPEVPEKKSHMQWVAGTIFDRRARHSPSNTVSA